jgi:hypothetical protein
MRQVFEQRKQVEKRDAHVRKKIRLKENGTYFGSRALATVRKCLKAKEGGWPLDR